jgi:1-deoxy-D-xylulose-5-phosphate reductoisomerase
LKPKRIAILGSTGSIGRQAIEVVSSLPGVEVCALAARKDWQLVAEQVARFHPVLAAMSDVAAADRLRQHLLPGAGTEVLGGEGAMTEMVRRCRADLVLTAVVGTAGLAPTLAAIECGASLAIANKETLVMAGAIVMRAAREAGVSVLPVDSEHSAIFQCLLAGRRSEVRRVVITASGGALRDWSPPAAENATVTEALNHPTWQMGRKITIDSATLLNKALEVVEAHWLFDLSADQIAVVLHPQSIVHSYVEFCDGSVIAQMGRPDMSLPIAYALCHPQRASRPQPGLDLAEVGKLSFHRPEGRFARAVELGFEVIRRGGSAGAVLNGANEAAVEAFLAGKIKFGRIVPLVEDILREAPRAEAPTLPDLMAADGWARRRVNERISERV